MLRCLVVGLAILSSVALIWAQENPPAPAAPAAPAPQVEPEIPSLALLSLPLELYTARAMTKERDKYHTLDAANEPFVRAMNTTDLLLGRTIVVGCRKAAA
ncbi:MAG: hypothetical protein M3032_10095 [Verrucomicrobiota bacterium]|nr:hypothetical protein [Verrucomicrobiota bacterium]